MMRTRLGLSLFVLVATTTGAGCSDVRLDFPDESIDPTIVDNELAITGDFCTSPAADVQYPVKIMFIVDGSGSQQFADQNRQRVVAVEKTINALIGQPNTFFKIVVFNAAVTATPNSNGDPPPPVFSNALDQLVPGLANLAEADTLTDYQGALSLAYNELQRDMYEVFSDATRGPAELSRTKYVVIFISDGFPDPQCKAGLGNDLSAVFPSGINELCENTEFLACLLKAGICDDGSLCTADVPCTVGACGNQTDCFGGVCQNGDTTCFDNPESDTLFGGMNNMSLIAGNDYNQPYQILQRVEDIMDLEERFQIGELRVHAGLVLDPLADPAIIALFGDATTARPLMRQMADLGEGKYLEFYGGDQINFLEVDFDSLKQNRVVRNFYAVNLGAKYGAKGFAPDTDFDGIVDATELDLGTDPLRADSDGDGYRDIIEYAKRGYGFDAKDPCKPAVVDLTGAPSTAACDPANSNNCDYEIVNGLRAYLDDDRDGLADCEEEHAIESNQRVADTDADGIPDLIEVLAGLDPLRWDYDKDSDQDGLPNGREIEWNLNPMLEQNDRQARERFRYDRPETGRTIDGRSCFDFDVRRIQLAATGTSADITPGAIGTNEIRLFILENMSDNLSGTPLIREACVRARYVPPSLKEPLTGDITLTEADFHYLPGQDPLFNDPAIIADLFDPAIHCTFYQ